ncbi:hypothetical protein K402DRAFT_271410 [Aulographum hederae CBS 113979]|uniref:Uncharacterized protein n=1 Tax=Aulographum hederae CBS 113979 TaxID=1176131 RepID=A0A6G1H8J8_9PEZI|nr:hypothetical protein K402DRAFT_271410 [Aulographum hederae CBS 113979]
MYWRGLEIRLCWGLNDVHLEAGLTSRYLGMCYSTSSRKTLMGNFFKARPYLSPSALVLASVLLSPCSSSRSVGCCSESWRRSYGKGPYWSTTSTTMLQSSSPSSGHQGTDSRATKKECKSAKKVSPAGFEPRPRKKKRHVETGQNLCAIHEPEIGFEPIHHPPDSNRNAICLK